MYASSLVLYRADNPFWLVEAALKADGTIVVISGNSSSEWFLEIAPLQLRALAIALGKPGALGDALLPLLHTTFAGLDNPYDAIAEFLARHRVVFHKNCWFG